MCQLTKRSTTASAILLRRKSVPIASTAKILHLQALLHTVVPVPVYAAGGKETATSCTGLLAEKNAIIQ